MKILGIDPGFNGGIAVYDGEKLLVERIPTIELIFMKKGKKKTRKEINLEKVTSLIELYNPDIAYIENVNARPGQGVTSMFRFGQGLGQLQGILAGRHIKTFKINPQMWKLYFSIDADKEDSLSLAKKLFPDNIKNFKLKKDDGLAEASLIAKYGYDIHLKNLEIPLENETE